MQVFAFDHFLLKDYFQRIIFVVKFGYKMYSSTVIIFFSIKNNKDSIQRPVNCKCEIKTSWISRITKSIAVTSVKSFLCVLVKISI